MNVSVCMAVYNGERFLKLQIESVLMQLGSRDELIIVNDASTDDSENIILGCGGTNVVYLKNDANLGVLRSFERAVHAARGDFIFLCDQDDIWKPEKVDIMTRSLKSGVVLSVSDSSIINDNDSVMEKSFFLIRKSGPGLINNLIKNSFLGCAMAFRKELKPLILPFPRFINMHDEWIGLVASCVGRVEFINQCLFYYRRHDSNVTSMASGSVFFMIKKRIGNMIALLFRMPTILIRKYHNTLAPR